MQNKKEREDDIKRFGTIMTLCMEQGIHMTNKLLVFGIKGNEKIVKDFMEKIKDKEK